MANSREQKHTVKFHLRKPTVESVTAELDELQIKIHSYDSERDEDDAVKLLIRKIIAAIEVSLTELKNEALTKRLVDMKNAFEHRCDSVPVVEYKGASSVVIDDAIWQAAAANVEHLQIKIYQLLGYAEMNRQIPVKVIEALGDELQNVVRLSRVVSTAALNLKNKDLPDAVRMDIYQQMSVVYNREVTRLSNEKKKLFSFRENPYHEKYRAIIIEMKDVMGKLDSKILVAHGLDVIPGR